MASLGKTVSNVVLGIIGIILIIQIVAESIPELNDAGTDLNATGAPFAGFFTPGGIVIMLVIVGILLYVINVTMKIAK